MNFIFFSAHFPDINTDFCFHLRQFGANVLGIGDTDYQSLNDRLKDSLTEYYKVDDLEDYDKVLRAVGYFTHKYGKIDRFESLNEHWLELEAMIRTDFNITGVKADFIKEIKQKSRMKHYFNKSGVETIPFLDKINRIKVKKFVETHGFPIIIKPDKGSGAHMTYKINNEPELDQFFQKAPPEMDFIVEVYVDGTQYTYDGLIDLFGNILFESSTVCEQSIMEAVNKDDHIYYINLQKVPEDVSEAGRNIIRSFDIGERFFHLELFKSRKTGELMALEVNMRPPGAWITDSINFSHDMNIYREWANMVVNGKVDGPFKGKYFTSYASRKNHKNYRNGHNIILQEFDGKVVKHDAIPTIFSRAMGNYAYQVRSDSFEEAERMVEFIQEEVSE
jgi:hypothetical protein